MGHECSGTYKTFAQEHCPYCLRKTVEQAFERSIGKNEELLRFLELFEFKHILLDQPQEGNTGTE
jgi:hypothetical protein